jgi:hypothetical protein
METKKLSDTMGGGIVFQRVLTDDGLDTGLKQTETSWGL